jgi:hypothetical protein
LDLPEARGSIDQSVEAEILNPTNMRDRDQELQTTASIGSLQGLWFWGFNPSKQQLNLDALDVSQKRHEPPTLQPAELAEKPPARQPGEPGQEPPERQPAQDTPGKLAYAIAIVSSFYSTICLMSNPNADI